MFEKQQYQSDWSRARGESGKRWAEGEVTSCPAGHSEDAGVYNELCIRSKE